MTQKKIELSPSQLQFQSPSKPNQDITVAAMNSPLKTKPQPKGYFITFEGGEGGGKSTQLRRVSAWLTDQGIDHIVTREPGGTKVAERIREVILSSGKDELDPLSEYLLFSAARRDHLRTVIEPALQAGKWVLSDRYYDSSVIYQGYAPIEKQPVSQHFLQAVFHEISKDASQPDITFIFDIDPKMGLVRAKKVTADENGIAAQDHFESKAFEFHQRVRDGFLAQAKRHADRCCVIDASAPPDAVFEAVKLKLTTFFNK